MTETPTAPWTDDFTEPSPAALAEAIGEHAEVFGLMREALAERFGAAERVEHRGLPWRWTIVPDPAKKARPALGRCPVFLVPDPASPMVCAGVPQAAVAGIDFRRASRGFKDAVTAGRMIGGRLWVEWPLHDPALVAEVTALLDRAIGDEAGAGPGPVTRPAAGSANGNASA